MNHEQLTENSFTDGIIITKTNSIDFESSTKLNGYIAPHDSKDIVNGQGSYRGTIETLRDQLGEPANSEDQVAADPVSTSRTPSIPATNTQVNLKNGLSYSYPPPPGVSDSSSTTSTTSLPYPPSTPHLIQAPLQILTKDPALGRGVFASSDISAGQIVEISPVLVLSEEEYRGFDPKREEGDGKLKGVEASQLRGYVFTWGKGGEMAVALGLGSLFNHSSSPNVSYEVKHSEYTIHYRAAKPIKQGEELFIFYGHSVRFDGDALPSHDEDNESVDDGWGGLGNLGEEEEMDSLEKFKAMSEEQLRERDTEIVGFEEPEFPFRKITEIIDPEDRELSTFPCYAIDLPARHSGIIFQFVRKHTSKKFNELQHLKRVRPIQESTSSLAPPIPIASSSDDSPSAILAHKPLSADALVSILLFPVSSSPPDLVELLALSPLTQALAPTPVPKLYEVDVPAQPAHTEKQAEEWNHVWPVTLVHIREGPKAVFRKKGWERGKMEWIEKEVGKVWEKAKEAGQRGEHPIACHVTDSWSPTYHSSLRPPATLVTAFDTRLSTSNCLSHAACNAIDAISVLDLHNARPKLSPEAFDPPYVLTGLTVFVSHEPCLLCAMSLLHSRIKELYYVKKAPGSGGCGSLYRVHEDGGLNHRYEVWEWKGREGEEGNEIGKGIDELKLDP